MNGERWVETLGAAVAIIGLVVVAPYQAGKALPDLGRWLGRRWEEVRVRLARFLPFLRRRRLIISVPTGFLTLSSQAAGDVTRAWRTDATVAEQLSELRDAVDDLRTRHGKLRSGTEARFDQVDARFREHEQAHTGLEAKIKERDREAARLNARGFPLAALGTALAGTPFWFVSLWWTPLFVLAVGLAANFLREAAPKIREGWSATAA